MNEDDLREICVQVWDAGQGVDLQGIMRNPAKNVPAPDYYSFLAGFVRTFQIRRVLEVGTHFGGSALAMLRGGGDDLERIVTVDLSNLSDPYLDNERVTKVVGDGTSPDVATRAAAAFDGSGCDLIYIDTLHTYDCTRRTLDNVCGQALGASWMIFDDIRLNEEMQRFWQELCECFGAENAIDITSVVPQARRGRAGFGLVRVGDMLSKCCGPAAG